MTHTTFINHNGALGLATTVFGRQVIVLLTPVLKFTINASPDGFEYSHVGPLALIIGKR